MRVWSRLRRHVWSTVAVAGVVAIVTATVVVVVAGARRTGSAPDRYTASVGGNVDGVIEQRSGFPLTDKIAALPSVKDLSAYTFLFGALDDQRHDVPENTIAFAGTRPLASRIVAGRDTNPGNPHEFVAGKSFVRATHAHVGDRFAFRSVSRAQMANGEGFNVKIPRGPAFDAVLVGILNRPDSVNDDYSVLTFPTALLRQDIGFVATETQVRLRPGFTYGGLRKQLDTIKGGSALSLERGYVVSSDTRTAVAAQATGLWVLALVLTIAALVALGQLLTRHVQRADHERTALLSVGFTRRQRVFESLAVAAVPTTLGAVAGALLAVLPSGAFPTGLARAVEPHTGISVDLVALAVTAGALGGAVLTWVVIAVFSDERSRVRSPSTRRRVLLARVPSTAGAIGARFAMTRGDRRRPAYGTIAGLALIVALVAAASTFAASIDRLVTDGGRFGQNYTVSIGDDGSNHTPAQLRAAYVKDPDVAEMMILSEGSARAVGTTVNIGIDRVELVKGNLAPHVLSGRLPDAADEIMLGRVSASDLGRHIGDTMRLKGAAGSATVHVVGIGIVPGIAGNDGVGQGGVLTPAGFARINGPSESNAAAIVVRAGAPAGTIKRLVARVSPQAVANLSSQGESPPSVILNVRRVRSVPAALAILLGVLALLTMLHVLFMSIRSRRVDVAILKGLGANRRWITRVIHSQASLLAVVPLLIGLPLGLLVGARIFRSFVERIGALPDATIPAAIIVGVAGGLLVLANVAALLPARRARRLPTAALLRAE
jgi:hypothetical protein